MTSFTRAGRAAIRLQRLTHLLDTGEGSDLIIRCDSRDFKVHRDIVCSASRVIDKELEINMRESQTGIIEHRQFSAETISCMLSYIYKMTYDLPSGNVNEQLIQHAKVYAAADYYQVMDMDDFVLQKFKKLSQTGFEASGFINVVEEICSTTAVDSPLQRYMLNLTIEHAAELFLEDDFTNGISEIEVLDDFEAEFLYELSVKLDGL